MAAITTEQALKTALAFFRNGQGPAAQRLCQQILSSHPGHPGAAELLETMSQTDASAKTQAPATAKGAAPVPLSPSRPGHQRRMFYGGFPGEGFGWGVCNSYLIEEFSKRLNVIRPISENHPPVQFEGDVLMVLVDHDFNAQFAVRGARNFGYTFFEQPLRPNAASNAAKYEVVFCGSTWCLDRMRERGIQNGKVVIQGVDHRVFHPKPASRPSQHGGLRIFSGGKFEPRKGQDIVIAAFREIVKKHRDTVLVCAWHHWWPQNLASDPISPHIAYPRTPYAPQEQYYRALLLENGIPERNFEIVPLSKHVQIAAVIRSTDFGVFPNRCEGGTNLMLMEYLACGRPAVATASTGHADVVTPDLALTLRAHLDAASWDEPEVTEVCEKMDQFLGDSALRHRMGAAAAKGMRQWNWERAARTIFDTIYPEIPTSQ